MITLIALGVVVTGTYLMVAMEPEISLMDALFEVTSASERSAFLPVLQLDCVTAASAVGS